MFFFLTAWFFLVQDKDKSSFEKKGDEAFARKEYPRAIAAWKQSLKRSPASIPVLKKLRQAYLHAGMVSRAEAVLIQALEIDPGNTELQMEMAGIEILKGNITAAEKRCTMLTEKHPDHPELNMLLGDMEMLKQDHEKAAQLYRKALAQMGPAPRLLLKLAAALVLMGKEDEADHYFNLAEKQAHDFPEPLVQLSEFFLVKKDYAKARDYLCAAVALAPEDLDLKLRLIDFYLAEDDFLKAEALLEQMVQSSPCPPLEIRKMLADVYLSLNKLDAAEQLINDMGNETGAKDIEFELLRGKYWLLRNNPSYAASHLKTAAGIAPGLSAVYYYLGVAYFAGGQTQLAENSFEKALYFDPDHVLSAILKAQLLYKKQKNALSLEYLTPLEQKIPENESVYILKGLNQMSLKAYESAALSFARALAIAPDNLSARYFTGVAAELSGREKQALRFYENILDTHKGLADVALRYVQLLSRLGKNTQAEGFADSILKENSGNACFYFIAAEAALNSQNKDKAERLLKQALVCEQVPGVIYLKLAGVYQDRKNEKKEIETLEQCTEKLPLYNKGWTALALVYLRSDQTDNALDIMKKARGRLPHDPEILSNLAWLYIQTGKGIGVDDNDTSDFDLALDYARKAFELSPASLFTADTLGWAYYHKKAYTQAAWVFSDALEKAPDNGVLLYHYGMTQYRLGSLALARKTLNKALEKDVPDSARAEIDQMLSELTLGDDEDMGPRLDNLDDIKEPLPFFHGGTEEDILEPQWKDDKGF